MEGASWRARARAGICVLAATAVWLGCVTIGRDFPVSGVQELEIGATTRGQVRGLFGEPWRVGIEDGDPTWTYALYRYRAFGPEETRDLVIRFDGRGVVRSYTFNSSDPADSLGGGS